MRGVILVLVCLLALATTVVPAAGQGCEDCEIIKKGVPEAPSAPGRPSAVLVGGLALVIGGLLTAAIRLRATRHRSPAAPDDMRQHRSGDNDET